MRGFLNELAAVAARFALTVVGVDQERWYSLENMQAATLKSLGKVNLRVYAPEDYLSRWRGVLASALATDSSVALLAQPGSEQDVMALMKKNGVTQIELAAHLSKSQQFISALLRGMKPWPEGLLTKAMDYIKRKTQTSQNPPSGNVSY
jgi:hypothetical protein